MLLEDLLLDNCFVLFIHFQLLTVCPTSNCLALVYRDKETVRFVKHINASCKDVVNMDSNTQEPSGFYDISCVYYE